MNIIFLGAPGAGKGTQARKVSTEFSMIQLSTGDMLREARMSNTSTGNKVSSIMDSGELVTDEIVIALIEEKLSENHGKGFIFDGFPRTIGQAIALDRLLESKYIGLSAVVEIKVENKVLIDRITGRYTCQACGEVYHESSRPLETNRNCDVCGSNNLKKRADDNEVSLRTRLKEYNDKTEPLKEYYLDKEILYSVDGLKPIDAINAEINKILMKYL